MTLLAEPLDQWTGWQVKNKSLNLLGLQYQDPSKYTFPFQMAAGVTKSEQLLKNTPHECVITERSLDSPQKIFVPVL